MRADCALRNAKNCTITPHIAWAPKETRERLLDKVAENIKCWLDGKPQNVVKQMSKAYLRIDDTPSEITKDFIDYLCEKNIKPIIFAVGENIDNNFDNALYALKKGAVIGNHSYSHGHFSEMSFEECIKRY